VTPDNEYLERFLAEHAAAKECGLLADGPTAAERSRLAIEMASVPGIWTGVANVEDRGLRIEDRAAVRSSILNLRSSIAIGAAAVLALAVGLWAWLGSRDQPKMPEGGEVAQDNPPPKEEPRAEFLNGRGRLVPVGEDTRYTLVDAAGGRVRLDQGQLFVELPAGEDLRADIETPAGTATALGTSFYAHYRETRDAPQRPFLSVAVMGGFVEVSNPHGRALAGAGEVVLTDGSSAPKRHSGSPFIGPGAPAERGWWRFGNVLGMLHRPEVQAELKLTEEQKAKLQKPAGEDWREIGQFFRDLYSVPPEERAKKAAEFRGVQEKKIAAVLNTDQQRRLGQILLQQQGLSALAQQEVADLLQLSEDQRKRVEAVTKEFSQTRRSAFSRGGRDWQEVGKRMDELRQQEAKRLAAVLTDAQQEQWRGLVGKPFELERRTGDWRDWWDSGNWGWWDSGNWMDGRDYWRNPENWRGPWGSGGWRERWGPPPMPGPQR